MAGRPVTREGVILRLQIRTEHDAHPELTPGDLRVKFNTNLALVNSALTKPTDEWQNLLESASPNSRTRSTSPEVQPQNKKLMSPEPSEHSKPAESPKPSETQQFPGIEQGFVKFIRKPAKMGTDFIFWIPRVYIRNGLVDPNVEYEVHMVKKKAASS